MTPSKIQSLICATRLSSARNGPHAVVHTCEPISARNAARRWSRASSPKQQHRNHSIHHVTLVGNMVGKECIIE